MARRAPGDEARGDPNPWSEIEELSGDRAAQYAAWADRLREKRSRAQATIKGEDEQEAPSYWTTENVYRESERLGKEQDSNRPDPQVVAEMLATLDLRDGASGDEIGAAYKRLVKLHHPDRHASADEATRSFHDERMREINAAYRSLRTHDRA